ncbi:hypothetical protein AA313_de0202489 [Arthrobotrys entomopaga]|nr:hypothetical protein AA313_de0202489 [Arthrobotrys entomopaga]
MTDQTNNTTVADQMDNVPMIDQTDNVPMADQTDDASTTDQTPSIDHDSLVGLLDDDTYSDVTVLVGPAETVFKLHRAIICHKSDFFKAACKPNFREGISGEIKLPEIKETAFKRCVRWMYAEEYRIQPLYNITSEEIQEMMDQIDTADYLRITGFKEALLACIGKETDDWMESNLRHRISGLWELFIRLAEKCGNEDWDALEKIGRVAIMMYAFYRKFRKTEDREHLSNGGSEMALAVIADIHAKSLRRSVCRSCMIRRSEEVTMQRCYNCLDSAESDDSDDSWSERDPRSSGWGNSISPGSSALHAEA